MMRDKEGKKEKVVGNWCKQKDFSAEEQRNSKIERMQLYHFNYNSLSRWPPLTIHCIHLLEHSKLVEKKTKEMRKRYDGISYI